MEIEQIEYMEYLGLRCSLDLPGVCDRLAVGFGIGPFKFGSEDATEWGTFENNGIEINVSRPYEEGTLQTWNPLVPIGCNLGIALIASRSWAQNTDDAELAGRYGARIADLLGANVHHYGRWLGPGRIESRARVFRPRSPSDG